jgi:hypothetical protein
MMLNLAKGGVAHSSQTRIHPYGVVYDSISRKSNFVEMYGQLVSQPQHGRENAQD